LGHPEAEIAVAIVGDRKMRTLNRQFRKMDRPTDVLSFSLREGEFPHLNPQLWGDIVISGPRAQAQAQEANHSLDKEMAYLLLHGILHLMGFDHEGEPSKAAQFKRWQQKLWPQVEEEVLWWERQKHSSPASSAL
jgi:rRNA maturation RNase YbeY